MISTQEKALPFEEAKQLEENAKQGAITDYDDATFNLLFKDDLQEKEFARVLLEHGNKNLEKGIVAEYLFAEILDETLFDNTNVVSLVKEYKYAYEKDKASVSKNFFIYHEDTSISSFAVSLLNFPYEESEHWKREFSHSTGYQKKLFEQSYEDFLRSVNPDNESELMTFLKMDEDRTFHEVESAVSYFKLRKIKRMILENQIDLEKPHTEEEFKHINKTHDHLKQMEKEITNRIGSVIIK
jgi:DNA primase